MKQHTKARIFNAIESYYLSHEVIETLKRDSKPERSDKSLIPLMYAYYLENYPVQYNRENDHESRIYHKELFIASVLYLFDKMSLKHGCSVTTGLMLLMAKVFGHNNRQSLTKTLNETKTRFKGHSADFRDKVLEICTDLKSKFQDRPVSSLQVSLFEMGGE